MAVFSFVISITIFAKAEDYQIFSCGPFGTLNTTDNPIMVPNQMAQDLLNVEISKDGRYVKKREGFSVDQTLSITTSPVHGIYNFRNSAGQNVSLYFNDTRISASVNDGVVSVIYSSAPSGVTYDCIDHNGLAYCVNTSSSGLYFTNGASVGLLTTASSTGTMITSTPGRLAMAGNGANKNTVYFSGDADFTNWVLGALDTSPIYFTITSPGAKLTHITYAFDKVIWFKDSSFGYIVEGQTQADWQIGTLNNSVGTLDNESVYWNGLLYFRGNDYHFYSYDGSNLVRISGDILNTIKALFSSNGSWEVTSAGDFNDGSFVPTSYIDTTTVNGTLTFDYPDNFSVFRDGTLGTKKVWGKYLGGSGAGDVYQSGGQLVISDNGGSLGTVNAYAVRPINNLTVPTTIQFRVTDKTTSAAGYYSSLAVIFSTTIIPSGNPEAYTDLNSGAFGVFLRICNSLYPGAMDLSEVSYSSNSVNVTPFFNAAACSSSGDANRVDVPFTLDIYLSTYAYSVSYGDTLISSDTHIWATANPYVYLQYRKGSAGAGTVKIDDFKVFPQTTTFLSDVNHITLMSTWSVFTADYQDNSGSNTFYMRSSNSVFLADDASPTWYPITVGAVPYISTGTYFQVKDEMVSNTSGVSPTLNSFNVSYTVGASPSDKSYASYFDDKIWWSVASGIGQTTNNKILLFDIPNNGWLIHDIPANGFFTKNNSLYFGSPTSGYSYKFGGTHSDNGVEIESYWKSKDFFLDNPFTEKEFPNISFVSNSYANAYATATYTLNGSSATAFQYSIYTANSEFTQHNKNLPIGKVGKTISIKYGNDAVNQPWELFGVQIGWRPRSWRPTP